VALTLSMITLLPNLIMAGSYSPVLL
jgi:hypothetical protein